MQVKIEPKCILVLTIEDTTINLLVFKDRTYRRFRFSFIWYFKK